MNIYQDFCCEPIFIKEDKEDYKSYIQIDAIMKKLFSIKNPIPIIDFLNSIYGDNISYGAKISYSDKEIINRKNSSSKLVSFYADMYITITDDNEVYEYALEFQTIFDKEIAVRIFRYSFERAVKLADYSKAKEVIKLKMPEPYIILIEEAGGIEDTIKLEMEFSKGVTLKYYIKVLRYWTYDLKKLYEENMYLLYPLQIFKLRKKMNEVSISNKVEEVKKSEMFKLYEEMIILLKNTLTAIDKAYEDGKIEIGDYNEMNIVIENLSSYFINMYGKYRDFDLEVESMVKNFYDPRVEERGMAKGMVKGIEKGLEKAKFDVAQNMLADGESEEKIKKYTGVTDKDIERIKKMLETQGEH
ncbi:hypothetical protein CLHOM_30280 [Clostridium homopropionicum DSM 5847]|uniref:PD-(D/E)XK nuclease family transposase n=1 Tax=Clostridium homopropionicum DSM 5847 TaxID=1121318 RepID=A0A0L6Z714_9CLOT|nr:hypothetical protein [Clostridium homopropionicum]KOA18744.1 hypothetical protein CLHOM_30280 [Clostridium homopropionicum DSM 5847]SFG54591.1 hypothetical protein SAMN04488501_110165 [Clostridium homopropionicum]